MQFHRCRECGEYGYIERNGYCKSCAVTSLSLTTVLVEGTPATEPDVGALQSAIETGEDSYEFSKVTTTSSELRWRVSVRGKSYEFQVGPTFVSGRAHEPTNETKEIEQIKNLLSPLFSNKTIDSITHMQSRAQLEFNGELDFLPRLQTALYDNHGVEMNKDSHRPSCDGVTLFKIEKRNPCVVAFRGPSFEEIQDGIEREGWHTTIQETLE